MARESDWIDVSVCLQDGMVNWPGDPPVRIQRLQDMDRGAAVNATMLDMLAHTGTHMDAPLHFVRDGQGLDEMPLGAGLGPARVIAIEDRTAIKVEELRGHDPRAGERILLRTRNSEAAWASEPFKPDYVHLTREAAAYLVERKVMTVGIDYLSVGGPGPEGDAVHRTLLEAGVWVIEGLDLMRVKPGRYELVCLPIKILRSDGAPCRAVLRAVGE